MRYFKLLNIIEKTFYVFRMLWALWAKLLNLGTESNLPAHRVTAYIRHISTSTCIEEEDLKPVSRSWSSVSTQIRTRRAGEMKHQILIEVQGKFALWKGDTPSASDFRVPEPDQQLHIASSEEEYMQLRVGRYARPLYYASVKTWGRMAFGNVNERLI